MKEDIIITKDTILQVPLLVPLASKYFDKISNKDHEDYYRAVDLRICLEKICDEYIYHYLADDEKSKWKKSDLHNKLMIASKYFDSNIVTSLGDLFPAKNVGNKGAHDGEEAEFKDIDFIAAQEAIFNFSLEMIVLYFKKNGYAKLSEEGSWVPYFFSTMPPLYRAKILRKYYNINPEPIVIEKLLMAYTKARMNFERDEFLDSCLKENHITNVQALSLSEEMKQIERHLDDFPIATTISEAKSNFEVACKRVSEVQELSEEPFVLLMSLIYYGSKEEIICNIDKANNKPDKYDSHIIFMT